MTARTAATAGAWGRLAAWLIDAFFLAALALLLLVTAIEIGVGVDEPISNSHELSRAVAGSLALALTPLLSVPLLIFYRVLFDASPGQLLAGVRVVTVDGDRPSAMRVLARGPALLLALLPLGLGVLWMFRDATRRALHDRLTATRVIDEDESRLSMRSLQAEL